MASNLGFNPRRRSRSLDIPLNFSILSNRSKLRMVLVGKTGSGKSSCGNTILGTDAFKSAVSSHSVTSECYKQEGKVGDWDVTLVDTPGLFETFLRKETIEREISKCINMSAPGPHAILIVVKAATFTAEERDAVKKVEKIFGEDCWRYTMMLFTHGDEVDKTDGGIEQCLKEAGEDLKDILNKMGNRYHLFNNANANHRQQVLQLLLKVEKMVNENKGQCYSNPTYLETVQMLDEREVKLRNLYDKKLKEEKQTLIFKYETKLKESEQEQKKLKELNKSLEMEKKELNRYYHALESGVRHIVEQVPSQDSFEEILSKFHETLKLN